MKFENLEEINQLLNIIDLAVRNGGLAICDHAVLFKKKLEQEAQSFMPKTQETPAVEQKA